MLDVLAARRIRASFFVIGTKAKARRALAERALAEGHRVGNHTMHHEQPLGLRDPAAALAEIEDCDACLDGLNPGRLFRPNGGGGALGPHLLHRALLPNLQATRRTIVLWNAVPRDWNDPAGWADRALAQHEAAIAPLLMVLHDMDHACWPQLDRALGRLADAGAEFVQDFPDSCVALRDGAWLCDPAGLSSGG